MVVMAAPETPVVTNWKSLKGAEVETPVTSSEKVMVKSTLEAAVGEVDVRAMDEVEGDVLSTSNEPISQVPACGRATPRWSKAEQPALVPASIAGEPTNNSIVCVDPPLSAKDPSKGFVFKLPVPVYPPWIILYEVEILPEIRLCICGALPVFPQTILLVIVITPKFPVLAIAGTPSAEFSVIVTFVNIASPMLLKIAPPFPEGVLGYVASFL